MSRRLITFFESTVPEVLQRIDGLNPHTIVKIVIEGEKPVIAVCRPEAVRLIEGLVDMGRITPREAMVLMVKVMESQLEDIDFPREVLYFLHRYLRISRDALITQFRVVE